MKQKVHELTRIQLDINLEAIYFYLKCDSKILQSDYGKIL